MNQKAVAKPSRGCVAADAEGRFKQAKVAEHNTLSADVKVFVRADHVCLFF